MQTVRAFLIFLNFDLLLITYSALYIICIIINRLNEGIYRINCILSDNSSCRHPKKKKIRTPVNTKKKKKESAS
jgi:hypothetical protein